MKTLILGGVFNDEGGRPSGYIRQLGEALSRLGGTDITVLNGGYYTDLETYLISLPAYAWVYWMGDIPNDKPKIVNTIHTKAPQCRMIISKNNRTHKYTHSDLMGRMYAARADGLIEFTNKDNAIAATFHPPSGTVITTPTVDITQLAQIVWNYQHTVKGPYQNHRDNEYGDTELAPKK